MQSIGKDLLAAILFSEDIESFNSLQDNYFYQDEIKAFKFIKTHFNKYGVLPGLTLASKKRLLVKPDTKEPLSYYLNEARQRLLYNKLNELAIKIGTNIEKKRISQALTLVRDFEKTNKITSKGLTTMQNLGPQVLKSLQDARTSEGITGVPTGWPTLDKITCGLQKGDVYVILARPKIGKSTTMLYLADEAHDKGFTPLFVSMEMRALQMARRFFAKKAKLHMSCLKSGTVSYWGEQKLKDAINLFQSTQPFHFVEGLFQKDINDITALIKTLNPSIVYIDGGYLLKILRSAHKAKWEKVTDIAEEIKTTAIRCNIPIVVSFQFTREVKKNHTTAGFENIQLADAIGQIASVGIGIFEDPDVESGTAHMRRRIEAIGGREGEEGSFLINWNWAAMDFSEVREEII